MIMELDRQITEFSVPEEPIPTTRFGILPYKDWCKEEVARLRDRHSVQAFIRANGGQRIAVFALGKGLEHAS